MTEKIKNVLNADYRDPEGKAAVQRILHKIKPFKGIAGDVPLDSLEKLLYKISRKYDVYIEKVELVKIPDNDDDIYKAYIYDLPKKERHDAVYGCTLYELYAKASVVVYDIIRGRG